MRSFKVHFTCYSHREPTCLRDVIFALQRENGVVIPSTDEEWGQTVRTSIDIRRDFVVKDGLREARKARFDPANLLRVCAMELCRTEILA